MHILKERTKKIIKEQAEGKYYGVSPKKKEEVRTKLFHVAIRKGSPFAMRYGSKRDMEEFEGQLNATAINSCLRGIIEEGIFTKESKPGKRNQWLYTFHKEKLSADELKSLETFTREWDRERDEKLARSIRESEEGNKELIAFLKAEEEKEFKEREARRKKREDAERENKLKEREKKYAELFSSIPGSHEGQESAESSKETETLESSESSESSDTKAKLEVLASTNGLLDIYLPSEKPVQVSLGVSSPQPLGEVLKDLTCSIVEMVASAKQSNLEVFKFFIGEDRKTRDKEYWATLEKFTKDNQAKTEEIKKLKEKQLFLEEEVRTLRSNLSKEREQRETKTKESETLRENIVKTNKVVHQLTQKLQDLENRGEQTPVFTTGSLENFNSRLKKDSLGVTHADLIELMRNKVSDKSPVSVPGKNGSK